LLVPAGTATLASKPVRALAVTDAEAVVADLGRTETERAAPLSVNAALSVYASV